MNLTITQAIVADIETLNKISIASKRHWGYPDDWIEHWRDDLTLKPEEFQEHKVFKAVLDSKIIGFCVMGETEEVYEVLHLWLDPTYIGKGYGKTLLSEVLAKVVLQSKDIIVEADPYAEPFYVKQGFVTFDQVASIYPEGRVLPVMKKQVM